MNEDPNKFKDHDPALDAKAMVKEVHDVWLTLPRKPMPVGKPGGKSAPGPRRSARMGSRPRYARRLNDVGGWD